MSDIYEEIQEDIQREKLEKFFTKYRKALGVVVVAAVAAAAGYVFWKRHEKSSRADASLRYLMALDLAGRGEGDKALTYLEDVSDMNVSGYTTLSRLVAAGLLTEKEDLEGAIAIYKKVLNGSVGISSVKDLATFKLAYLYIEHRDYQKALDLVKPYLSEKSSWRFSAHEITALVALDRKEIQTARESFETILREPEAPQMLQQRAREFLRQLSTEL